MRGEGYSFVQQHGMDHRSHTRAQGTPSQGAESQNEVLTRITAGAITTSKATDPHQTNRSWCKNPPMRGTRHRKDPSC